MNRSPHEAQRNAGKEGATAPPDSATLHPGYPSVARMKRQRNAGKKAAPNIPNSAPLHPGYEMNLEESNKMKWLDNAAMIFALLWLVFVLPAIAVLARKNTTRHKAFWFSVLLVILVLVYYHARSS